MQVFYGVLLQYVAVLANKKPLNFKLLTMLVKPLIEMSLETPYFAAICARERLLRARTQFCEDVKNTGKSCWPSLKTLFLLRLWSMIFPCSNFRHAVVTPAILLMSEYLMRCPIISGQDVAIGSFLCSMLLSISRQSQKFCPEAILFIETMLMTALNNKHVCQDSQGLLSVISGIYQWNNFLSGYRLAICVLGGRNQCLTILLQHSCVVSWKLKHSPTARSW